MSLVLLKAKGRIILGIGVDNYALALVRNSLIDLLGDEGHEGMKELKNGSKNLYEHSFSRKCALATLEEAAT